MKNEEKSVLKEKIILAIKETEERINKLELDTQPIAPENSIGRISRMDAINNKSVAEAALRTAKAKHGKLKLALSSIEKPGFGLCSLCKQPIPIPRLMYIPESTRCVRCADRK